MAQILDPIPADRKGQILCCYVNATSKIQIARVSNIPNWYFERVVFPGQRLVFEAFPEALLEIHTGMMASAILSDKIPCGRLRVIDESDPTPSTPTPEREEMPNRPHRNPTIDNKGIVLSDPFSMTALTSV
ncbi:DUF1830 domain-containing protein [Laspinema olomoucense]|uniref:DUF1830 domain-containing protein n=1 Tax=Laspinema olomoucense D3b TaxID=2953688 RepID=A0ABT2N8Q1_9CYAN|nr:MULTISPECIES: DUF1830 domain-containing protein [unclassified Laspinema]MCT7973062.1 DUF1830 domain-containing protein [Laspinema sp. D3d]MCT7977765.1 DUF1830 domain-containing protein [Laspinema sp. D3b]MCT7989824.1 DUF1830 domain-containing protein [Laspinema sp. D3a]